MMQVGSMAEDNYANMWPDGSRAELQSFFLSEWLLGDYLKARPAANPLQSRSVQRARFPPSVNHRHGESKSEQPVQAVLRRLTGGQG